MGYLDKWNAIGQACHQISVEKGWYQSERSDAEMVQLMVTELAEATEEVRNNRAPIWFASQEYAQVDIVDNISLALDLASQGHKPEGELIEIADCAIRILDFCAAKNLELDVAFDYEKVFANPSFLRSYLIYTRPAEIHFAVVKRLCAAVDPASQPQIQTIIFSSALTMLIAYCTSREWSLEDAMKVKMAYNRTRSFRHGNKVL
jgi:hypothetical protein